MLSVRLAILALKKKKESCAVLVLLIVLAVLFLDLGLSTNNYSERLYYEKTKELNGAHFLVPSSSQDYQTDYEKLIEGFDGLQTLEKEEVAFMLTSTNNCNDLELGALLLNKDAQREIAPLHIVEEDVTVPTEQAIYVPLEQKDQNVKLGEDYALTYKGQTYSFRVAGYFEATNFSNINSTFYKYFISNEAYQKMIGEIGRAIILSARFEGNEKQIQETTDELYETFKDKTTYVEDQDSVFMEAMPYSNMMMKSISNLFIGVALILLISAVICLILIFLIRNHIKDDVTKSISEIGTLEAMGYTHRQIRNAFLYEYLIISFLGVVIGIIGSYMAELFLQDYLTRLCSFGWRTSIHPIEDMLIFFLILVIIALTCLISIRNMKSITPVTALSQRGEGEISKTSFFPLHKGRLSVNLHIAIKNLVIHSKSNVIYGIIVLIGSFAIGLILIVFLNFSNVDMMLSSVGFELSNLQIKVSKGVDVNAFADELTGYPEVRKTTVFGSGSLLKYGNEKVNVFLFEDYDQLEYIKPFSGSYPKTNDEVLISYFLHEDSGKSVGDSIILTAGGAPKEFLISGVFSCSNGYTAFMKPQAMEQLIPEYEMDMIGVYLEDEEKTEEFHKKLENTYKVSVDHESASVAEQKIARLMSDYGVTSISYSIWKDGKEIYSGNSDAFRILDITDLKGFASAQIIIYANRLKMMVGIVFITMLLIVSSVLRMTVRREMNKSKKEFGILKAMGYTTKDIRRQISLRFLIATLMGSTMGAVLSFFFGPTVFAAFLTFMGVSALSLNSYPLWLFLSGVILSLSLYLVVLSNSRKIKAISAYELMSE